MGTINWTKDQQQIIDMRGCNILVSAAAGSGKTAVLVERIFKRITDKKDPVNVDQFVVVTFTKLAAAQMKDRLRERIEEALAEPSNEHLLRQEGRLSLAHFYRTYFCSES
ncbi:MAG: UvrD-helicase domain-containing protein [Clostridium sp.]